MNKAIISILILVLTVITSGIFLNIVMTTYPELGSFYNLLYLGLLMHFFAVGVFISALFMRKSRLQSLN